MMCKVIRLIPNPVLPPVERIFYGVVWIGTVIYAIIVAFHVSMEYRETARIRHCVGQGWRGFELNKDISDYEWQFWSKDVLSGLLRFMIGHGILSQFILYTPLKFRGVIYIMYSLLFTVWGMGVVPTVFYIAVSSVVVLCAWIMRSSILVWIISLIHLLCMNMPAGHHFLEALGVVYSGFGSAFLFQEYFITLGILRYISLALHLCSQSPEMNEFCKRHINDEFRDSFIDKAPNCCYCRRHLVTYLIRGYCYLLYIPLAVGGPFITFEMYNKQLYKPADGWTRERIVLTVKNAVRFIVWLYLYDLSTHYIYFSCIISEPVLMRTLKLNEILSIGYVSGVAFMVKYLVIYSLGRTFALLDGIYAPDGPSCVAHIASYSKMWRKFDRGLNQFMVTHIYIPIGGSRFGFARQAAATFICFLFIAVWHGTHDEILYWTSVNCLTVLLEVIGERITGENVVYEMERSVLSPVGSRRVRSICLTPLVIVSTFAIFFFLGSTECGFTICYRVIIEGFPCAPLLVFIVGYCLVQVSKEVENWEATRKVGNNSCKQK